MSGYQLIAALGSSFAAGPGIDPVVDRAAMRSGRNYAHQLAERLAVDLVDLTVSGATTANVIDEPQQIAGGPTLAPQIEGLPAAADVVTITAGGNDLQFSAAMLYRGWLLTAPGSPIVTMLEPMFRNGIPAPTPAAVERAAAGLVRVVDRVRRKAPQARVLLVDYLTVLDATATPGSAAPLTADDVAPLLDIQSAVARVFVDAAERTGAELVRASALSTEHALGSAQPWVQPFHRELDRTAGSFHPNDAGMTAVAAELERVLAR